MHSEIFDQAVLPIRQKLYRFAFMIMNNRPEAEDIVQNVMMKLWLKKDELRNIANIEAWSMTLVKNLAYDGLRKIKRQNSVMFEPEKIEIKTDLTENIFEANEKLETIHRCVNSLPDRQRQAVFLRDIEGQSYKEISIIMGIDENLVKVTLFRARENLRKKILKIENYGL